MGEDVSMLDESMTDALEWAIIDLDDWVNLRAGYSGSVHTPISPWRDGHRKLFVK